MDNRKTIYLDDAIDAIDKRVQFLKDDPVFRRKHGDIDLYGIKPIIRALPSAQPERKNESVGCNGCRYDWFGDPRCNRCARSFQDRYEAEMRGEQNE